MQAFGPGILSTSGSHHRKQRKLLNPAFSVNNIRHIKPIFYEVTRQFCGDLDLLVAHGPHEINLVQWAKKLEFEIIGQAGLGHSFGTFEGREDEFLRAIKQWMPTGQPLKFYRPLLPLINVVPNRIQKLMGQMLPWPSLNRIIDLAEIMNNCARGIYETKKSSLELGDEETVKKIGNGKDLLSVFMRANAEASEQDKMSEDEICATIVMITLTAIETLSSAFTRVFHLLALHPDAQDKLRKEIKNACYDNEELTYDHLVSLPFMDAVCRETLRLYPPVVGVTRTAISDTILPLSAPIHDVNGREIKEVFVPKSTKVFAHVHNLNRDTSIWGPDAAEWKPERWLEPLPETVEEAHIQGVYANTLTFIAGPRACLGFKFAQLEIKVALSQLIPAFRFEPTETEVVWLFDAITTPSVKGSAKSPGSRSTAVLPLLISRYEDSP